MVHRPAQRTTPPQHFMKHPALFRGTRRFSRCLLALAGCISTLAHAVDDTVTGANGTPGTPGINNNSLTPGTPGGDGGTGANAAATAVSGDAANRATATGGNGGAGGDGGSGSVGADAGAGANAGSATATATTNNLVLALHVPLIARAIALGGRGGSGGFGGFGVDGVNGEGGDGALGGAAIATALATGPLGLQILFLQWNEIIAEATGGLGGAGLSRGGLPGLGGNGGDGGRALATAHGDGVSGRDGLLVSATQRGGQGGFAASGGIAGDGADSIMLDAVSGRTLFSDVLELRQIAVAGSGGAAFDPKVGNFIEDIISTAGAAGNASSRLTAGNATGNRLLATVSATGGNGGFNHTGIDGGNGGPLTLSGNGTAGGTATAGFSLTVVGGMPSTIEEGFVIGTATAVGGAGSSTIGRGALGIAGHGGAAVLAPVFAQVTTQAGQIRLTAEAFGGAGGASERGLAGNGAPVNLLNAMDGAPGADGSLSITQRAVGGGGGFSFDGTLGQAGTAASAFNIVKSVASLSTHSIALGGGGAERKFTSGIAGTGGVATASNTARNTTGSLAIFAEATGGGGGNGNNNIPGEAALITPSAGGGAGGAATSNADGRTDAETRGLGVISRAIGGDAGRILWGRSVAGGGAGGNAQATAQGTTAGQSSAHIASEATGGRGGGTGLAMGPGPNGGGGAGGDAQAVTTFSNHAADGSARIEAVARGGSGGSTGAENQTGGHGGGATAGAIGVSSDATSLDVLASVFGGGGGDGYTGGNGAGVSLDDAAIGSTRGPLTLSQRAFGGGGGAAFGDGAPGAAGIASSALSAIGAMASSLFGESLAQGGAGGSSFNATAPGAAGGAATASIVLSGVNNISAMADVTGGAGGHGGELDGGAPGAATLGQVRGVSTGGGAVSVTGIARGGAGGGSGNGTPQPGGAITLGNIAIGITTGELTLKEFAFGGKGGAFNSLLAGTGAAGGAASTSLVRAVALPALTMHAESTGGDGGSASLGTTGRGGNANAMVIGENARPGGTLAVSAKATGGFAAVRHEFVADAPGGGAVASASGSATGPGATAEVSAIAISPRRPFDAGGGEQGVTLASTIGSPAHATATGSAPEGVVAASASTFGGAVFSIFAESSVNLLTSSSAESSAQVGAPLAGDDAGRQAWAFAAALPVAGDIANAVTGNPNATAVFTTGDPDLLALGSLGARHTATSAGTLGALAQYALAVDVSQLADPRELLVGLMNPVSAGGGFDSLRFQIGVEGNLLVDVFFTDRAAAQNYFDDQILDLGPIASFTSPSDPGLEADPLEVFAYFFIETSAPGDRFSAQVLVANAAVPEPSGALLLALGLGTLAARRRRVRPSRGIATAPRR